MGKTALRKRFPFLYQLKLAFRDELALFHNRKRSREIRRMTDNEVEALVSAQYRGKIGREVNFEHPRSWTEKIQWSKLYDSNPQRIICADKYAVQDFIRGKGLGDICVHRYASFRDGYLIRFRNLPERFVVKANNGSGDIVFVRNKSALTFAQRFEIRRKIHRSLNTDYSTKTYELHYRHMPRRVIVEELLGNDNDDLKDYKFLCFDGKVCCCWVDLDRFTSHHRNVYDLEWKRLDWIFNPHFPPGSIDLPKPQNYDRMIEIASILSEGFGHVRVDLYNLNGKIYFGEMTFTSASGYHSCDPQDIDLLLGDMWDLDLSKKQRL